MKFLKMLGDFVAAPSCSSAKTICGRIHEERPDQTNMAATIRKETSWRRRWKPDINSQAWKPFIISGNIFLVKTMFVETECCYEFCLWDFSTMWYEKVVQDNFRIRAKVWNCVFWCHFLDSVCLSLCHWSKWIWTLHMILSNAYDIR